MVLLSAWFLASPAFSPVHQPAGRTCTCVLLLSVALRAIVNTDSTYPWLTVSRPRPLTTVVS